MDKKKSVIAVFMQLIGDHQFLILGEKISENKKVGFAKFKVLAHIDQKPENPMDKVPMVITVYANAAVRYLENMDDWADILAIEPRIKDLNEVVTVIENKRNELWKKLLDTVLPQTPK